MEPLSIAVGAAFGALIGFAANRLAIWMLFHPVRPIRLGPLALQGVIPKRRRELAARLADAVSENLISGEEILEITREAIEESLSSRLPSALSLAPAPVREAVSSAARAAASALAAAVLSGAGERVDVRDYVLRKLEEVGDEELERMFREAVGKELTYISLNDAAVGALVGALEAAIVGSRWGIY